MKNTGTYRLVYKQIFFGGAWRWGCGLGRVGGSLEREDVSNEMVE